MPSDPGLRAVVFDFGGVLITSISNQIGDVAASHAVDPAVMHEVLLGPRVSWPDHPWHRAERGELAVADIQAELTPWGEAAGIRLRGDEMERLLAPGAYSVVGAMLDRVDTLRADGYRTALLTNTFAEFRPTMERDLDFDRFDAVVESFAVGSRKPEAEIYVAAAEMLEVGHASIVYLDDFDQNLSPAAALGWTTILVGDPRVALDELDAILGTSDSAPK
ncbi:HAD family hydrolase [Ilumatobacter sp.]|uniref:HAD family hydrolase n=1 Tax=Ilumatobacter sp. TaxID=1967498 RepID=UPI003C4F4F63